MEDFKYLQELLSISTSNTFIPYIINRVTSNDYRGYQCSQHNRLTYDYFDNVIRIIYDIAGENKFKIHIGDDTGIHQSQAGTYYKIVDRIKQEAGKGTINSVKKNTFPDIARMGFLDRYDINDEKIEEHNCRKSIYSVQLSDLGIKFANAATALKKIKLFTDGIDILTNDTGIELAELLSVNNYGVEYIDILEYMYILSDNRTNVTLNDKMRLLLEYRQLKDIEKEKVTECLKKFCNPQNRKQYNNKTLLRDYSNWKNESQQIFGLFRSSTYFKVEGTRLILNTGDLGIFNDQVTRTATAKKEYYQNHHVSKTEGYELHHIVPFSRAENKKDTSFIDDYKNLIYLKTDKHLEFPSQKNNFVRLSLSTTDNIVFLNFKNNCIIVNVDYDALLSKALLQTMKEYNDTLLRKFYYSV